MKLITTDFTEVKVFVEKESDLYDRFDPEEDMISADVTNESRQRLYPRLRYVLSDESAEDIRK